MNELLQKHGCSNVFTVPEGLKELMSDITREVLRVQPIKLLDFIANYLSALIITREHGIMAVSILDDLCDCRPSVSEHLLQLGLERPQAATLSEIIKTEIELIEPVPGKENIKEYLILKKLLTKVPMDEELSAKVCQVVRNAYRDFWYRKDLLKKGMKKTPEEPWEIAAQHTLELYKKTKPSLVELHRATEKIQAAYKGYHIRRNVLTHLLPKKDKKYGRKVDLSGPPLDVAASREIDLGPVVNIRTCIKEDNVDKLFDEEKKKKLGIHYDPLKTITHEEDLRAPSKKGVKLFGDFVDEDEDEDKPYESRANVVDETLHVDKEALEADEKQMARGTRISFSGIPEVISKHERIEDTLAEVPEERVEHLGFDEDFQYEVPEDIGEVYDDYTESGAQSAPDTADNTDVEDLTVDGEGGE
ncbi:unnamed protein product [Arctia plantaginis]|uniref:RIIa domain-containing protein n=1 Tax=Arctia plantaginis TaxID=874455 RepID=A0A8S1BEJ4_ARCPL|nr:unnamed protein product [Arctia plantaginis]CAB3260483.1 unnamed protein product [Arctia plantaginis]